MHTLNLARGGMLFVGLTVLWFAFSGCATTSQIQALEEKVVQAQEASKHAMREAEAAKAEAEKCCTESTRNAERAEKAAMQARSEADRAEEAAIRARSEADRAQSFAEKSEKIFEKIMSK
ncbi:MAG: hypothetical protein R6V46_12185 [Desulfatiglandaceae bacterium]